MNEKILVTLENVRVQTFARKNGRTGQKIVFLDGKMYRHEIECVDKEDFDFTRFDNAKSIVIVCTCRNQKVSLKFGDVVRDTYVLVLTAFETM